MHRTVMVLTEKFYWVLLFFLFFLHFFFWILALDALEKSELSVLEQCGVEMDT